MHVALGRGLHIRTRSGYTFRNDTKDAATEEFDGFRGKAGRMNDIQCGARRIPRGAGKDRALWVRDRDIPTRGMHVTTLLPGDPREIIAFGI